MRSFHWTFFTTVLVSYLSFFQPVSSKGTLSIQLLDYNNPSSKDYAGSCCDCCGAFGWCPNDCENFFRIIVTSYPYNFFNSLSPWSRWETFVLGDDSFDFPGYGQSVGSGLNNPLTYHFTGRWPKAFAIALDVWDDDGGNFLGIGKADDLVDVTSSNVGNVPAQKDLQSAVVKSVTVQL